MFDLSAFDITTMDITQHNVAVEEVLAATTTPRHRYLLQAYLRHRYLESAGRYEEVFDPQMTVENPFYRFAVDGHRTEPAGREQVEKVYRHWSDTDQCVRSVKDETVAVGDNLIVGRGISYQQTLGSELAAAGIGADPDVVYLKRAALVTIWPYDDQGRLLGEDVWEFNESERALIKLDPADVLTAKQAGALLEPYIHPLPTFYDSLLPA